MRLDEYAHVKEPVQSHEGHWRWDEDKGVETFQPDGGAEQGDEDGGAVEQHMGGQDPALAKAVGEIEGPTADTSGGDIDNIEAINEAANNPGSWETDASTGKQTYKQLVPQAPGAEKFYHEKWLGPESHGQSAYEPDYLHDNSEYFGPFVLDYNNHIVKLPDWNLIVQSQGNKPGRGNVAVGLDNFFYDGSNSFVAGRHNIVRGKYDAVFGGKDNAAEGDRAVVSGGQRNVASGAGTSSVGGYRNEALGENSAVIGGTSNLAKGKFSAVSGGIDNIAVGDFSVVGGGSGNQAEKWGSAVGGGEGNKAIAKGSFVMGGLGGQAEEEFVMHEGEVPEGLRE